MNIQHQDGAKKGKFYTEDGLAEIVYNWFQEKAIIIEHTEVSPKLEGKGVGKQLVKTAVEYARTNNIKIIPLCPFAKSVFDRLKDWQDVLVK